MDPQEPSRKRRTRRRDDILRLLPKGRRLEDPPPDKSELMFRLSLAARKYPVQIALTIALLLATIPVYMVLASNSDLRQSNRDLRDALVNSQATAAGTTRVFCKVINQNALVNNGQTEYLQALIIESARQSKPFDKLYRAYGFPTYPKRVRRAVHQAERLGKFRVQLVDCDKLRREVQKAVQEAKKVG